MKIEFKQKWPVLPQAPTNPTIVQLWDYLKHVHALRAWIIEFLPQAAQEEAKRRTDIPPVPVDKDMFLYVPIGSLAQCVQNLALVRTQWEHVQSAVLRKVLEAGVDRVVDFADDDIYNYFGAVLGVCDVALVSGFATKETAERIRDGWYKEMVKRFGEALMRPLLGDGESWKQDDSDEEGDDDGKVD